MFSLSPGFCLAQFPELPPSSKSLPGKKDRNLGRSARMFESMFPISNPFARTSATDFSKKAETRRSLQRGIRIRKQLSNIANACSSQQRIGDGMAQNIAIGMPNQSQRVRNDNTAKHQWCIRPQSMEVEADANSKAHLADCSSSRSTRARTRSVGRVILIFRSEPLTIETDRPIRSTRLDSSVP